MDGSHTTILSSHLLTTKTSKLLRNSVPKESKSRIKQLSKVHLLKFSIINRTEQNRTNRTVQFESTFKYRLVQLPDLLKSNQMLKNINEDIVQIPLELWQAWDINHFALAVSDHPHIKEMFPNVQCELLTSVDFNRKGFQCLCILCKMEWEIMSSTWKCFCALSAEKRTRDCCRLNIEVSHWFQCALDLILYTKSSFVNGYCPGNSFCSTEIIKVFSKGQRLC